MNNLFSVTQQFYDTLAPKYDSLKKRHTYYHTQIQKLYSFIVPKNQNILEIGCATGDLLAFLAPQKGTGIDISKNMIRIATQKYPKLIFHNTSAEKTVLPKTFDYIILPNIIGILSDIQMTFHNVEKMSDNQTRIIISYYNYFWEPLLVLLEKLGLKIPQPLQNWITNTDIENILDLVNLEVIKQGKFLLIPFYIPIVSHILNTYVARLPVIRNLCFIHYVIARKKPLGHKKDYSVSIIIPARNESGNIKKAVVSIPKLGKKTEIIFVEGHSKDDTREKIKAIIKEYPKKNILYVPQNTGIGKADAVRRGIIKAKGDIIMIFDADLTVDPTDLPKFYNAMIYGQGEFIQGSRLVYQMEKQAMQFLNILGNKFFGVAFTFLLDQPIKDTLCGTKVFFKKDYAKIVKQRSYFGDFDPFGDFDLLFGFSKLNIKIKEIPIRYKARSYGKTNISRFRHGLLLLKMTLFAARKIKFF